MSSKTLIKCDRCKDEWEANYENKRKQIWKIGIGISCGINSTISFSDRLKTQEWCRKCIDELQMIGLAPPKKDEPASVEISFEDKVIELLNELGFYQEE